MKILILIRKKRSTHLRIACSHVVSQIWIQHLLFTDTSFHVQKLLQVVDKVQCAQDGKYSRRILTLKIFCIPQNLYFELKAVLLLKITSAISLPNKLQNLHVMEDLYERSFSCCIVETISEVQNSHNFNPWVDFH